MSGVDCKGALVISVQNVRSDDPIVSEVDALLRRSFAYMDDRIDPPSSLHRLTLADIEAVADRDGLVCAFDDGELVGCVFFKTEQDSLYIGKLAVEPSNQGQGIGRRLLIEAEKRAIAKKLSSLRLETRIELTENHRTFEKFGFVKTAENAHAGYDRPTSITMIMRLDAKGTAE